MTPSRPSADLADAPLRAAGSSWRAALALVSALRGRRRADAARRSRVRALRRDELVRIEPGRVPASIACRRGTCWVTQAGDPQDHVLLPGDRFRPETRGLVVVWAFTDAEVEL